ncbi:unnamed protein product [Prunus armeniaca]|uniref:Retrotransposon gag domain-containing protein n=1 Tax=Prunus armeniaca TaxID=36596 RepID=A0A6J5WUV3_PRUAR|nr:unnamed protein product [Prunus armeniaca]
MAFTAPNHPIFDGISSNLGWMGPTPQIQPSIAPLGSSPIIPSSLQQPLTAPQYTQPPLRTTVYHTTTGMQAAYSGPPFFSVPLAMSTGLPAHHLNMKPMKLDLPRFYGEDPYGWLAMAERFLEYHEVDEPRKVMVAAMHLGGDAALWMKW